MERKAKLTGYELYLVEQWACSRKNLTFIITTYTGLEQNVVSVGVLGVPIDESEWSLRLKAYLKEVSKFHARRKETALGYLMVTNLGTFPSALTVIPIPQGDVRKHRDNFIINENLKRLGCSGRAGLNLSPPSSVTQAKFSQLYLTSDLIRVDQAVVELVKLCQVALALFTKLAPEYVDGLLCDKTESAVNNWWTDVGLEYYDLEPTDGILGPTTVSALLGMLLGARNRLNVQGAPVAKDVFDLKATKRGIAYFQRLQKLEKTSRLDDKTLKHLHKMTSKAANSEGWAVPKAVKSTVAELSGKGGEMVMGMVGGRDRAGLAEIETLDINKFVALAYGEQCKWLWHGKAKKSAEGDFFDDLADEDEAVFSGDELAGYPRPMKRKDTTAEPGSAQHAQLHFDHLYSNQSGSQTSLEPSDRDPVLRKTVFKTVTGRMNEARSGLGRFKDAVGIPSLRGHNHKISKDGSIIVNNEALELESADGKAQNGEETTEQTTKGTDLAEEDDKAIEAAKAVAAQDHAPEDVTSTQDASRIDPVSDMVSSPMGLDHDPFQEANFSEVLGGGKPKPENASGDNSSLAKLSIDWTPNPKSGDATIPTRSRSTLGLVGRHEAMQEDSLHRSLPRSFSYNLVDDVFNIQKPESERSEQLRPDADAKDTYAWEQHKTLETARLTRLIDDLEKLHVTVVERRVKEVEKIEAKARQNHESINTTYVQKYAEYDALFQATRDLVAEQKASLSEALKTIDSSGAKIEYELNALLSKIEDVEDGVAEYERQVLYLEDRVAALEDEEGRKDSWALRALKLLTGVS